MRTGNFLHSAVCLAFVSLFLTDVAAAPPYSSWSTPVNLGATINSPYQDFGPAISKDGLSLYFSSDRPGGFGSTDIWVSQRATKDDAWGPPMNLGGVINGAASDNSPAFSRDGHWMFYGSTRSGGFGNQDIWVSWRADIHDDFAWEQPFNAGAGVNTPFNEAFSTYFENDDGGAPLLFFSSRSDIYVSQLGPDGEFLPSTLVPELSSAAGEQRPAIRFDGLEIIFVRNPPGLLFNGDLWVSNRESVIDAWSTPEDLGTPLNTPGHDAHPYISADGKALYFNSDRPGGFGALDLYVSTRTKARP
jgi:Tol biopolymer transport system component